MPAMPLSVGLAVVVLSAFAAAAPLGQQGADAVAGHVIRGRVVDPHLLRPEGAVLMLGQQDGLSSYSSVPVPIAPDGSFVTPRRGPGVYVLELVRTPHSATNAAQVVGQKIVELTTADISGVTVDVRRDSTLTGRFRMESDNPKAEWPSQMQVLAFLALDGLPMLAGMGAEGGPGGTFVLRNAFGPRVLRCGYTIAAGPHWWPSRVLLDGRDVTNVPTDFSEHPNGQLEIVFTQHPARIAGRVTDAQGRPVDSPWVTVTGSDRASLQLWSTTSEVAQGGATGRFSVAVVPGEYRVNAVPGKTFSSWSAARHGMSRIAFGGTTVVVKDRETKVADVTLQER